jgi:hypothetical protein
VGGSLFALAFPEKTKPQKNALLAANLRAEDHPASSSLFQDPGPDLIHLLFYLFLSRCMQHCARVSQAQGCQTKITFICFACSYKWKGNGEKGGLRF